MDCRDELSVAIKAMAHEEGFDRVGITSTEAVSDTVAAGFKNWLAQGHCGTMAYMSRNVEKRLHPQLLVAGARSVICLAVSYAPDGASPDSMIARYARGRDYHRLLKRQCIRLMDRIRSLAPEAVARAFVDTAPVMERSLAVAAGVGWIGKSCIIRHPSLPMIKSSSCIRSRNFPEGGMTAYPFLSSD